MIPEDPNLIWLLALTFLFAFFLAFSVGANDVANSFGTSVGSKVLTLKQACILATIFEILGSVLMGYQVSGTVRKGVIEIGFYEGREKLLIIGYLSALVGSSIWNLIATYFNLPISGTHSIIGAIVGFHVIDSGFSYINYAKLGSIVISWFLSPALSGLMSVVLFIIIHKLIINHDNVLQRGLASLPLFYGSTVFINTISILTSGPKSLYLNNDWFISLCVSTAIGLLVGLIVYFLVVPRQRTIILAKIKKAKARGNYNLTSKSRTNLNDIQIARVDEGAEESALIDSNKLNVEPNNNQLVDVDLKDMTPKGENVEQDVEQGSLENSKDLEESNHLKRFSVNHLTVLHKGISQSSIESRIKPADKSRSMKSLKSDEISFSDQVPIEDDKLEVAYLFKYLQILTACFASFAHGGNDVSNAIGPLIGVLLIWQDGNVFQQSDSPIYLMLFGGFGISVGLWVWGRKVIQTVGKDLTKIVPSTGFTIELGAATTVLMASKLGIPISTTHCKVGSVICVGQYQGSTESVNWKLFNSVMLAWVATVPISATLSAFAMFFLRYLE